MPLQESYGRLDDGTEVWRCTLAAPGIRVRVLTFGGVIESVEVPDRSAAAANVALGLTTLDGYANRSPSFGATVGRYANRIAGGRFALDGRDYQLVRNDGPNALHGGPLGFGFRTWSIAEHAGPDRLVLSRVSPDGEEGYPGTLRASVAYTVAPGELRLDYAAETDKPTVLNLTNHSYWNLAGEGSGSALDHVVTIPAGRYAATDAAQIPTELRPVDGTPFDFRQATPVGARIRQGDPQLLIGRGYDHCWVLDAAPGGDGLRLAARVQDPGSGRTLEVLTDQPGVQFYSGNRLDGRLTGPSGRAYRGGDGLAFETQHLPDSPNRPDFPSTVLRPGTRFRSTTLLRFSAGG